MAGVRVFLNKMFTVFLDWVNPASTPANPKCMINTRAVAIIIQTLLAVRSVVANSVPVSARVVLTACNDSANAVTSVLPCDSCS